MSEDSEESVHLECDPRSMEHRPWVERRRQKLPEGSRRRWLYDTLFLPVGPPTEFLGPKDELIRDLMPRRADGTPDEERTKEVLEEAQATYTSADERAEGAQSRATTLQGAVAVAASLLLAGGALLADPTKVRGDCWRVAFAVVLFAVVFSLVASGARALAATSRIQVVHRPTAGDITRRSGQAAAEARVTLAAELLRAYACNTRVADWKVAYLGAAAWWFRWALLWLLVLATLLGTYGIAGPRPTALALSGPRSVRASVDVHAGTPCAQAAHPNRKRFVLVSRALGSCAAGALAFDEPPRRHHGHRAPPKNTQRSGVSHPRRRAKVLARRSADGGPSSNADPR